MRQMTWWKCLAIMLIVLFSGAGCWSNNSARTGKSPDEKKNSAIEPARPDDRAVAGETVIVLYFSNNEGYLAAEKRAAPKTEGIGRVTVQELIKGPAPGSRLNPTIPRGTVLRNINIKNGLATVDFSKELKTKHGGGSTGELMTVFSIVNTLTQFPAVQKVQILIDGQKVETLAGHVDLTRPLTRDEKIIQAAGETKNKSREF